VKKIVLINKKEGETPLEAVSLFRKKNKEYKEAKITYAGRLDPMAKGLLLLLVGDEVKNKEKYLSLDKEYEFEILFGFSTDTYDVLGKVLKKHNSAIHKIELEKKVKDSLKYFKGKFLQKYPIYSSKTVLGKPLFQYGRDGEKVDVPEREVLVKKISFIKLRKIKKEKLSNDLIKRISKVKGDFRQKEILLKWEKLLKETALSDYFIASFKISCSSGTYVRGIANSLGERINTPALAYSIKRTKIGKYDNV
jgi:tRNA pseudouridine55 synthase